MHGEAWVPMGPLCTPQRRAQTAFLAWPVEFQEQWRTLAQ